MIARSRIPAIVTAGVLLLLAGCGNAPDQQKSLSVIKDAVTGLFTKKGDTPSGITVAQIDQALAASPAPLAFATVERAGAQSLIIEIARNGVYQTFATPDRQSLTFRNGMLTSTRGLGGDLMSSDEETLLAAVRNRMETTAPYVMRFLDGENQIYDLRYQCQTKPGGSAPVQLGEIDTLGTIVTARCTGTDAIFNMTFVVDDAGNVLSARQWVGNAIGFLAVQQLRL